MPARLITMQSHPEMDAEILGEILECREALGIIEQETYENAMRRVNRSHDGLIVAKAFLKFCLE